jgi:hypothetical protein
MKKPEGPLWKFFRSDYAGPRIALMCLQPGSDTANMARAYVSVHDPKLYEPKNIEDFAKWAISNVFKQQFEPDEDNPPVTREITAGETPWTVVIGKGPAAGIKSGWGTIERRYYFTQLGDYILYADAYVRLGADDEAEALWKCIESITLPVKK